MPGTHCQFICKLLLYVCAASRKNYRTIEMWAIVYRFYINSLTAYKFDIVISLSKMQLLL